LKKDYIFTPGPTPVPPEVGIAQVKMIHHRSADFGALLERVLEGLKYVYQTDNEVLLFTSSGTGAMEGSIASCFSPCDKVIAFAGGKFGERLVEISSAFGLEVVAIEHEWGANADPADLARALGANPDTKGVLLTQSETSTGVVNDVEAFGKIVAATDALFLVDAISGLGAVDLKTDAWGVDLCVSKSPPETPYTPAITLVQGLDVAIGMLREEGLDAVFARHRKLARATQAAVEALGLRFLAQDRSRAFVTTSVWAPDGISAGDIVKLMRNEFGVFIAGGQGKLKGKIFRLGHVGYFDPFDIVVQVGALEMALNKLGVPVELGSGVAAAMEVLAG
jgi:aspartate aminotransferase-like enzyme